MGLFHGPHARLRSHDMFVQPNKKNMYLLDPAFHLTDDMIVAGFSGSFIELLSVVSESENAEGRSPTMPGLSKRHQRYCAAHKTSGKPPRQDAELPMGMERAERFDGRSVCPISIKSKEVSVFYSKS